MYNKLKDEIIATLDKNHSISPEVGSTLVTLVRDIAPMQMYTIDIYREFDTKLVENICNKLAKYHQSQKNEIS